MSWPVLRAVDQEMLIVSRYIFSADGKYILGGMMVGDTSDYVKLLSLVKKKVCRILSTTRIPG